MPPPMTPESTVPTQEAALKSLFNGRSELAETRLAVTATQIVERLMIRAGNLTQLMDEELAVDNRLLQFHELPFGKRCDMMGLETMLLQRTAQIQGDRRRENTECWRDLTHAMRDFLNAWEGFSRNEAKNRFLEALPNNKAEPGAAPIPVAPSNYHNDHYTTNYPKK
ncbi:hypothetical protein P4B35_10235 [Pontiellaceae bacterium B12227]|nr:hypothetical protein [Pontiellaceae bacterium B12227]